ncbi:MAG: NADP-specific glutamate dehydrogenase [Candidatus Comchoanobacterales bacterium]
MIQEKTDSAIQKMIEKNPGETEFLQAIRDTYRYLIPYIENHPKYDDFNILERLSQPDRIITFRVTWEDDHGKIHNNTGYRVQHCNAIGPYKGGLRFHPSVNLSILKFLAYEQTFKNSLTGLPLGGGKGGSDFDPKGKSDTEIKRFCQAFMTELSKHIGPYVDVPAGDIGVGAREVSYLFGEYKRLTNRFDGVITGKGLNFGGSQARLEATGYGTVYMLDLALKYKQKHIQNMTCTLSGSGNVSLFALEKLIQMGAKAVTLSDSSGFIHDPEGFDLEKLHVLKNIKLRDRKRISAYTDHYPHAVFYANQRPWIIPCDCAIPCATENEIDENDMATLIKNGCIAVAEGANMPTTHDAKHLLPEEDFIYIPGIAANAGGVAVSGIEMAQNSSFTPLTHDEVDSKLKRIMANIHHQCEQYGTNDNGHIDYEKGATIAGFIKVADALIHLGV